MSARVERFFEPALLLALRGGQAHGYELVDAMSTWGDDYVVDSGNLYRMLRSLEDESLIRSSWADSDRGAARRVYALEPKGERVLEAWAEALAATGEVLQQFRAAFDAADDAREAS
ncbi:MAG: PadR family transcriptional regulator [Acidimicrobiia bacterium]|nr:PadR family transcriptional regulator [Acidimicrobiia bacterium]